MRDSLTCADDVSKDEHMRCWPAIDLAYTAYHDENWGRPIRDELGPATEPVPTYPVRVLGGKVVVELP